MMHEGTRTDLLLLRRGGVASGAKAVVRADEQPLIILIADTLNSIIFEILSILPDETFLSWYRVER